MIHRPEGYGIGVDNAAVWRGSESILASQEATQAVRGMDPVLMLA